MTILFFPDIPLTPDHSIHLTPGLPSRTPQYLGTIPRHRPLFDTAQLATGTRTIRPSFEGVTILGFTQRS